MRKGWGNNLQMRRHAQISPEAQADVSLEYLKPGKKEELESKTNSQQLDYVTAGWLLQLLGQCTNTTTMVLQTDQHHRLVTVVV